MRHFDLLNLQHVVLYLLPALIFIFILGVALAFSHWRGSDSKARKKTIIYTFPAGIEDRNAPFPLIMTLTIIGTIVWALGYILAHGLLGVKI